MNVFYIIKVVIDVGKRWEDFLLISIVLCLMVTMADILPLRKVVSENSWIEEDVQISAHRGGALLNPENTQKAFDYVIMDTDYTDIIELDLRLTKDNVIVINHDEDINRMALDNYSDSIKLSEYNYVELLLYNLGRNFVDLEGNYPYRDYSSIDALNEGLTLMRIEDFFIRYNEYREFKLFIEIKDMGDKATYIADEVMKMLDFYSWYKNRSMIISFDDEVLTYMDTVYPEQYIGALGDSVISQIVFSKVGLDYLYNPSYECIQVPYNAKAKSIPLIRLDDKMLINSFKKRNQLSVYWGIVTKEDMIHLINHGVNVITTDRPDLMAEILGR